MPPTVSICIPAREAIPFLRRAIESVLAQTFSDWELVVSDNGSLDDTAALARSFGDPRIRVLRQPKDIGMVPNFQKSFEAARGTWVLFLPCDDIILPDGVRLLHERAASADSAVFAFGGVEFFDESDRPRGRFLPPFPERIPGEDYLRWCLREGLNPTHLAACLVRRRALDEAGGLDPDSGTFFDWNTYLRLAARGDAACVRNVVARVCFHPGSETSRLGDPAAHAAELIRALRKGVRPRTDLEREGLRTAHRLALKYARKAAYERKDAAGLILKFFALPGVALRTRCFSSGLVGLFQFRRFC